MNRRLIFSLAVVLLVVFGLVSTWHHVVRTARQDTPPETPGLVMPALGDADYDWIGSRIYRNEALGKPGYLTHWNQGEDFASLGIGHFIWFPQGVDAPFDEQFPAMFEFVSRAVPKTLQAPDWIRQLDPFDAPWDSKHAFDEAWSSPEMAGLRQWLQATQRYQARFIVAAFERRWRDLELPAGQKQRLTAQLQQLFATPEGLFAVIDYYNFKGLGNNPRERYADEGWGLVQVLEAMAVPESGLEECADIVGLFRDAAASRLTLRVELSPPERNEARWLEGWLHRLDGYLAEHTGMSTDSACGFRVTPYLQNPSPDAMTLIWLSNAGRAGRLKVWEADDTAHEAVFESGPVVASALDYHAAEACDNPECRRPRLPYLHQLRITGLRPGATYRYQVTQDTAQAGGSFTLPGDDDQSLRFIVYGDSETEPESTGTAVSWPGADWTTARRRYLVDQTTGYRENLRVIRERQPAFVAIAGDLVQSGGEQRDWDEFWRQNAALAAATVLVPALGNHDYFGGPGELGKYATEDSERSVRKYLTYFDLPANGASHAWQEERYYALHYGVVTLIVLDTNDGLPDQSEMDTNWRLRGAGDGGFAPGWQAGSAQYAWLEETLRQAQQASRFTFVMFHGAPYTSGVHGRPPGDTHGRDILSAQPLQSLTPLFMRYGVDAVFSGHDEMYEHSVVSGMEVTPNGDQNAHDIHFYDVGIGGDGLRGPVGDVPNPYRVFLADSDAPEVWSPEGVLIKGGKHYGHLEVNVSRDAGGRWQASMDPVYIFPVMQADGSVSGFERRLYDDSVTLTAH